MPGGEAQLPVDELAGRLLGAANRFQGQAPSAKAGTVPPLAPLEAQVARLAERLDQYQTAVQDYRAETAERRGAWRWLERAMYAAGGAAGGFVLAKIAEILT